MPVSAGPPKEARKSSGQGVIFLNRKDFLFMAIVPSRRSEERSLAQRGGDPFSYLRNQINRVFDEFWGESGLEPRRETGAAGFWPQVDVTETDKEIKVC